MNILWVGDSPTISTGFGICSRQACEHLISRGHDVTVLGLNYFGDPHELPMEVYPCISPIDKTRHPFGFDRLPYMIDRLKPDVVVFLQDPWNIRPYFEQLEKFSTQTGKDLRQGIKFAAWLAIDGENIKSHELNGLLDVAIPWTEFGALELRAGFKGKIEVCPLGVELDNYPQSPDPIVSRPIVKDLGILPAKVPDESFIVGYVGRNQFRKRLDLTLSVFARWIRDYHHENDDIFLFLYTGSSGDRAFDIPALARYNGLIGRVILAEPRSGEGIPYSDMRHVYSSCDVILSTTQGEGWGLPFLEAAACGRASIVPDWSGLGRAGGWPEVGTMFQIPCASTCPTAPFGFDMYTVGGVIDERKAASALEACFVDRELLRKVADNARAMAEKLTWENSVRRLAEILENV